MREAARGGKRSGRAWSTSGARAGGWQAIDTAEEDWAEDAQGGETMDEGMFCAALFQLADSAPAPAPPPPGSAPRLRPEVSGCRRS